MPTYLIQAAMSNMVMFMYKMIRSIKVPFIEGNVTSAYLIMLVYITIELY